MLNKSNRRKNKTKFHKTQLTFFWREDNVRKQVTETKTEDFTETHSEEAQDPSVL